MSHQLPSTNSPKHNAGGSFIEALISVLLVGILSAGTIGVSSRVAVVQAKGSEQQLAINQMSNLLRSGAALCSGNAQSANLPAIVIPNVEASSLRLSVSGCASANTSIGGKAIANARTNLALTLERKNESNEFVTFVRVGS